MFSTKIRSPLEIPQRGRIKIAAFQARLRRRAEADEGLTTLDLIFGFIGVCLFVGLVLTGVPLVFNYFNQMKAETQLSQASSNIINRYANGASYTGLTTALALSKNFIPASMLDSSGNAWHALKGQVTVGATTIGGQSLATITFEDVPYSNCLNMINAGGAVYVYTDQQATPTAPPFNLNTAVTDDQMCPSTATNGVVNITWIYR